MKVGVRVRVSCRSGDSADTLISNTPLYGRRRSSAAVPRVIRFRLDSVLSRMLGKPTITEAGLCSRNEIEFSIAFDDLS